MKHGDLEKARERLPLLRDEINKPLEDFTELVGQSYLHSNMLGVLTIDVRDSGHPLDNRYSNMPFTEALDFFKKKKILTPGRFKNLTDSAKRRAFTVGGLYKKQMLEKTQNILHEAIGEGLTVKEFKEFFDNKSPLYGATKQGAAHLETVFQNAVFGAFNEGRYIQQRELIDTRPYWRYVTVDDNSVRASHKAMHGKVYAADDPIWKTWYPPNGHRCRCTVVTLSETEMKREGYELQSGPQTYLDENKNKITARPDEGWSSSPEE